jgi:hypothetical protein
MRVLGCVSVFPVVLLLMSSMAVAQPAPPTWDCRHNAAGEESCRVYWDDADRLDRKWDDADRLHRPPPLVRKAPGE